MRRFIRMFTLAGAVAAVVALVPASASATTTVSPPELDFGTVPVGQQSPSLPVTLTESCTADPVTCITIPSVFSTAISTASGFTQSNNCPPALLAMLVPVSCQIDVSFIPVVGGPLNGLLNTGPGGPTVALRGNGAVASAPPATGGKKKKCKKKKHRATSSAKKKCKKRKK